MMPFEILQDLIVRNEKKIILIVIDGVGGLPLAKSENTELETASTPNLDKLASMGICGLSDPVSRGITPGSGPSHLSLFGYDPLQWKIGRGVLEALGIGLELTERDLAVRGNFATRNTEGIITDRRAGRISTEKNRELCEKLQQLIGMIEDIEVIIRPGKEHRFVILFRGENLEGELTESDPQKEGLPACQVEALDAGSEKSARIVQEFISRGNEVLSSSHPANTFLLRGLAKCPAIPSMEEVFGLRAAAIAVYPMYRGIARLVGMDILSTGESIINELNTLRTNYSDYHFFYLHVKGTDSAGEDGDFSRKVRVIEEVDRNLPLLGDLHPDVLVVTGDHSTPSVLKGHSWHPNPFILVADCCLSDGVTAFSERVCARGGLGRFPAVEAMTIMLAHALKLKKFGA